MEKIKISFILPCFNVENYISDCIESLLNQDIKHEEYEVICVDDCSYDKTINIITDYSNNYPNIKLIKHETNRSAPAARNTGINNAIGDYLWFVDPDDLIKKNCLSMCINKLYYNDLDVLIFNNKIIDENGQHMLDEIIFKNSVVKNGFEFIEENLNNEIKDISVTWRAIFKSKLILDYNLCFPEIRACDDSIFVWECIFRAQRVCSISDEIYFYRVNQNSITSSVNRIKADFIYAKSFLFPLEIIRILNENQNITKVIKEKLIETIKWSNQELIKNINFISLADKRKIRKRIFEKYKMIKNINSFVSFKQKFNLLKFIVNSYFT